MSIASPLRAAETSYDESLARWTTRHAAADYPSEYSGSFRDRCELRCIRRFVESLPSGAQVLDLPCGTGRLTTLLYARGLRVVGADCSPWMVSAARQTWERSLEGRVPVTPPPAFEVRQALDTGFADGSFDAVICNRLFHHFRESSTRTAVFRELGRVSRGPILASFFCSFAFDALRFRLRHWLRGTTPTDRIPIPLATLVDDARAAGLEIVSTHPVVWGFSPMWYVVARSARKTAARAA